jgi:antitoxin HicB
MAEATIKLHIEPLDEGGYLATSDDVPGLIAQGRTVAETTEIARDICRKLYESYVDHGERIPLNLVSRCFK